MSREITYVYKYRISSRRTLLFPVGCLFLDVCDEFAMNKKKCRREFINFCRDLSISVNIVLYFR